MGSEGNRIHELTQFLRHLEALKLNSDKGKKVLTDVERVWVRVNKFGAWLTGSYKIRYGYDYTEVDQFNIELDDEDLISLYDKYSAILDRKVEEERLRTLEKKEQELVKLQSSITQLRQNKK